jgi:predicted amino acid-binding ACT domain protein
MLTARKVAVWTTTVKDGPSALRDKMQQLAMAGADLDFVISRHVHEDPGSSVIFLTPLVGDKQTAAAERLGFQRSHLHSIQVIGPDEPGVAYRITSALAEQELPVRGVSAARLGNQFTMYLSFDSDRDAERAIDRLNRAI